MSRPVYEVWLGEGRGTRNASSLKAAKAILRKDFGGRIFLSDWYRTDEGVGWAAYDSSKARSEDVNGFRAAYTPSIERIDPSVLAWREKVQS